MDYSGGQILFRWTWTTRGGWRDGEETTVRVRIDRREEPGQFAIYYGEDTSDDVPHVAGELVTTAPHLGGVRYWWQCPQCWRRCRVIYAYPAKGRERFMCRRCQRLRYYSHTESRADRLLRKSRKLYRRAGSKDGTEPWQKPRWMRWQTFSRLVLAGRAAGEQADLLMCASLGLALARIQRSRKASTYRKRQGRAA
jgi:hypothetical protein